MQLWKNMRWCKTKLATPKLNWAPYHIIGQCFYVYVLLEGGHSVKNKIQQKMTTPQKAEYVSHLKCVHMHTVLWIRSHFPLRIQIKFPVSKYTYTSQKAKKGYSGKCLTIVEPQLALDCFNYMFLFSKWGYDSILDIVHV